MSSSEDARGPAGTGKNWFGKYELLSTIGSGGMATVFRACLRGPGHAARPVALKLIHPHLSEERKFVLMFLDEMRVAMAFTHRNIVQTFDAGKVDDRYYLVMELIDGCSLRGFLTNLPDKAVPVDIALFLGMELASALAYAHTFRPELTGQPAAVIHRDVSPSNILLARDGGVKLADFGVARAMDALGHSSVGAIKGKLSYMAPEQARGSAERRSDVFAAGVVLYEMLSGDFFRPSATLEEVLSGPTAMKPLSMVSESVPVGVDQLVQRCLSPDPSGRPASAEALREELSEAYFKLQTKTDPHARLSEYLNRLPNLSKPQDGDKGNLAAAILAGAKEVPTAGGKRSESTTAPTIPSHRGTPARVGAGITDTGTETRTHFESGPRWQLVLAFGGALLIGGIIGLLYLMPTDDSGSSSLADQTEPLASLVADAAPKPPEPRVVEPEPRVVEPRVVVEMDAGRLSPPAVDAAVPVADSKPAKSIKPRRRGGRLVLNSLPWSKVFIDGRYRGDTPLEGLKLSAGRHHVRLLSPQRGLSRTFNIYVRSGAILRKVVDLNKK